MKVLRLYRKKELKLHSEPIPDPAEGQVLVKVEAVGICGSDLHWFEEAGVGDAQMGRPLVLGHEFAGRICGGPLEGRRVAVDPAVPCGRCEFCQKGNQNLCSFLFFAGHAENDGALREYLCWPDSMVFRLPEQFSAADGAMLEPLGVALHAVDLGPLQPGMSVGVYGCGPIGLLLIQLARLGGATEIVATDPLVHRLDAAGELGATATFPSQNGEEASEVLSLTRSRGVDVAFEVAGDNGAVDTAVASVKPGGKVILVGIPSDESTVFSASVARRKGITVKWVRRMKHTYPRAINLVRKGLIDVRSIVSHNFSMDQYLEAFEVASTRSGLKVIIQPDQ